MMSDLPVVYLDQSSVIDERLYLQTNGTVIRSSTPLHGVKEITELELSSIKQKNRDVMSAFSEAREERRKKAIEEAEETRRLHTETIEALAEIKKLMASMKKPPAAKRTPVVK